LDHYSIGPRVENATSNKKMIFSLHLPLHLG
jgi:hypothetical protein